MEKFGTLKNHEGELHHLFPHASLIRSDICTSLREWKAVHAVVACGSYANAAEFLHVSQPAVSYSVANLEKRLGVNLLKLEGRKAIVTEQGTLLLEKSRSLLQTAARLEHLANHLRQSWKPHIKLVVDLNFPTYAIVPTLCSFSANEGNAKVSVHETFSSNIEKMLRNHVADIAITRDVPLGFQGHLLVESDLCLVVHSAHPLAIRNQVIRQSDLDSEIEILVNEMISNGNEYSENIRSSTDRKKPWIVNNFNTVRCAIAEGVGYTWLPTYHVRDMFSDGKVSIVATEGIKKRKERFYVVHSRSSAPNCQTIQLVEALLRSMPRWF